MARAIETEGSLFPHLNSLLGKYGAQVSAPIPAPIPAPSPAPQPQKASLLKSLSQKLGEGLRFAGQGPFETLGLKPYLERKSQEIANLPSEQKNLAAAYFGTKPSEFGKWQDPSEAQYISPGTAEFAKILGAVPVYIAGGGAEEATAKAAGKILSTGLARVAPKAAASMLGKAAVGTAAKGVGQAALFGGVKTLEEAISGLTDGQKADLAQSAKNILASAGEGFAFGLGQGAVGEPLKNVAAKALPILSKPGVSAAAARGATGAVAGAAAMAPLAGMHYAQNRDLPSALGELAFGATMEGVPAALGGPASYAARVRTINEAKGYVPKVEQASQQAEAEIAARRAELQKPAETPAETPQTASESTPVAEPSPVTAEAPGAVSDPLEAAAKEAGFNSVDEARAALNAAEGQTFYRGEMVPAAGGEHGKKKNIMRVLDVQDVVGQTNEGIVARQQQYLEQHEAQKASLLAQAAELEKGVEVYSNGYPKTKEGSAALQKAYQIRQHVKDVVDRDIQHNQSVIDEYKQKIADAAEEARIAQENNDLLYLTSQEDTAKSYAQGSTLPDILTGGKPEGYNPTVYSFRGKPEKVFDLTPYGQGGIIQFEEAYKLLRDFGLSEKDTYAILDRATGFTADDVPVVQTFRLFRGKALPIMRQALKEAGYDTVHYIEGKQDNWIFLDRSKAALQSDIDKLQKLSPAALAMLRGESPAPVIAEQKTPQAVPAEAPQATAPAEAPATVPIPAATAPAPEAPTANAGIVSKFAVGDTVRIKGRPDIYTVTNTSDPSLLGLRSQYGAELKAGRSTVEPAGTDNTATQTTASATEAAATAETATAEAATGTAKSDRVQAVVLPYLQEFIEQDVIPKSKGFVQELRTVLTDLVHWLSPRTGVSDEGLTLLMKMKGERDKALFIMERTGRAVGRQFARMPQQEQVAFIDRIKKGEAQPTPELQAIADYYRKMDDATFEEIKKFRPSLPFLENHFRVLWKVIPGHAEEKGFLGLFRRPLQGSKGFLKHATLADMSEGIAKGGVPVTHNPQTMFELAQADAQRFITAQRMWAGMKEKGFARFVRMGDSIPEGYVRLNDAIAKVYFPTEEGLVGAGEYYVEANTARLLNNFLSRDLIRETALGHGLMWMKNLRTAVELSLSPFHFVFETIEAIGSQQGVGFLKLYNQGVLKRDPQAFLAGLKDIVTSPLAWKDLASTGGGVLRYVDSKEEFLKTLRGQKFIKQFPDAEQVLDDLFAGGGKLAMHEDYRLNTAKTFLENINSQNYIGATIRLVPALNEVVMTPLFEQYIPRLKIGLFFKEYGQQLAENSDALLRGEISREKLARQTWDRVENRFGEMNFDNLFWNRTLKTGLQLMFRSVTWKLGNVRGFSSALANQARNFADPLAFARDEAGRLRYKGKAPKLDPGMAWALGMMTTTATLASIIQFAYTGTWPQELKDYLYPKIGGTDDKGNDNRVSLPTYFRDVYHLWKNPVGYVKSSMSGFMTNFLEAVNNKDYYGNYIYDPEGPAYQKLLTSIAHVTGDSSYTYNPNDSLFQKVAGMVGWGVPMPFSVEQAKRLNSQGASFPQKLLSMSGFTKAPSDVIQTQFQQKLLKAYLKQRGPKKPLTPAEQKLDRMKRDLRQKVKDNALTDEDLRRAIALGLIKPKGVRTFMKDAGYNSMQIMWKYLSRDERDKLLPLANAEELDQLKVVR